MDPLRPPPLKRLRPGHWVAVDCACTVLLALGYAVFKALASLHAVPHWAAAAIVAVAVLPAAFRRRWPRAALALVVAGGAVAAAISPSPVPSLAVAFVMYVIPLRFPRRAALWLLCCALLVTAAGLAAFATVPHGIYGAGGFGKAAGLLLESGLLITVAWLAGYSVRQQRAHTAGLQEQAEQRAREQLAEARRASSEERLQIARELHDVVAHTLSLIAVQAGVANYVAGAHPEEAARALSSIEEISRGALREMRALLGVLRADGNGAEPEQQDAGLAQQDAGLVLGRRLVAAPRLAPPPGLADLDSLVERTAEAGVRVDLDVCGQRPRLSAGLDLAAYRVIQEAITNVIRHAATDSCRVAVAYQEDALTLEITDGGGNADHSSGSNPTGSESKPTGNLSNEAGNATGNGSGGSPAPGHGIIGMRERVGMYGGEFRAAPLPGRGFRVTARFPLADTQI
jgi:signal transduction histidine kinase